MAIKTKNLIMANNHRIPKIIIKRTIMMDMVGITGQTNPHRIVVNV